MVSVASLLNPLPSESPGGHAFGSRRLPSPCSPQFTRAESLRPISTSVPFSSSKGKDKLTRDAAVFIKGKTRGEVCFPPFEDYGEDELREVEKFHVTPLGRIADFARHIPYNSEKKGFCEKTGRESFEVFQYTFTVPGDYKEFVVMWDYNVGLVRITPFFKCCKYSKTTPGKMLNSNPGLKDICHSITGGSIAAQGYWMPYEAAKAVATTFCYRIRHALFPIFGPDFIDACITPDDPAFGRMVIESAIVDRCTAAAHECRALRAKRTSYQKFPLTGDSRATASPALDQPQLWNRARNLLESKPATKRGYVESGYGTGTESDPNERYLSSPPTPVKPDWTAIDPTTWPSQPSFLSSTELWSRTSSSLSPTAIHPKRSLDDTDIEEFDSYEGSENCNSSSSSDNFGRSSTMSCLLGKSPNTNESLLTREARAAYMLLQLHVADQGLGGEHRDKRLRMSASL